MFLAPVHSLPVEVLSCIFELATHVPLDKREYGVSFDTDTAQTPLVLSWVCRQWRFVARITTALWTNICITKADIVNDHNGGGLGAFNTDILNCYLSLSKSRSLDILIDARDPDWDFSEPGVTDIEGLGCNIPFNSVHMITVIEGLVPHLHRLRSIIILTDLWAPMNAALRHLNPIIMSNGAPSLENLVLMRCNEYVSNSLHFQPRSLAFPALLAHPESPISSNIFPKLSRLVLNGVHVHWGHLHDILESSKPPLEMLNLSSHSLDVRPTLPELHNILSDVPHLKHLRVWNSGPAPYTASHGHNIYDISPEELPQLESMSLGYRAEVNSVNVLHLFNAPNLHTLILEDATHPGDPEDEINANTLFAHLASGRRLQLDQNVLVTYSVPTGLRYQFPMFGRIHFNCKPGSHALFPNLQDLVLRRVKPIAWQLHAFLNDCPVLKRLELDKTPFQLIQALFPSGAGDNGWDSPVPLPLSRACPCPKLVHFVIKGHRQTEMGELGCMIGRLANDRAEVGGAYLRNVDIEMDLYGNDTLPCGLKSSTIPPGTMVNVSGRVIPIDEEWDAEEEEDSEEDAYLPGGAFNDPVFDAHYSTYSEEFSL